MLVERTVKNWFSFELELNVSVVTLKWWLLNVMGSVDIHSIASEEKVEKGRLEEELAVEIRKG